MLYVISSSWRGAHLFPRIRSLPIVSTKYPELTPDEGAPRDYPANTIHRAGRASHPKRIYY